MDHPEEREFQPGDGAGTFLRNVSKLVLDYTASHRILIATAMRTTNLTSTAEFSQPWL
jgi:hypothetical protein